MFLESLAKIVSGSVVGYVTNDLAVQMLFRKRFGLGGIVLKTHTQFVENISVLVERDIVNHHTLSREFEHENFRKVVADSVNDFYANQLPIRFTNLQISDIQGANKSWELISQNLFNSFAAGLEGYLKAILQNIQSLDLIEEQEAQELIARIIESFKKIMNHIDIESSLSLIIEDATQHNLEEIFGETLYQKLSQDIGQILWHFYESIVDNPEDVSELIGKLLAELRENNLFTLLAQSLSQKSIFEFLDKEQWNALVQKSLGQITQFIHSEKGDLMIETLSRLIVRSLSQEKITIFDLLNPQLADNFKLFLQQQLPQILESFIIFIQAQKEKIDELIDVTFRNNTNYLLQDWLLDIFVGSISEKAKVVKRIVDYIENYDVEELAQMGSNYVVDYLQRNTLSDIIAQLNPAQAEQILTLAIKKNIDFLLLEVKPSFLDKYLEAPIQTLVSSTQIERFLSEQIERW
ncbi:MAG: DUF445 family protein, partial [Thermonemataceae bacterium]|nr:DUF445 family protein [Thermonemataceae bacterium]